MEKIEWDKELGTAIKYVKSIRKYMQIFSTVQFADNTKVFKWSIIIFTEIVFNTITHSKWLAYIAY